MAEIWAPDFFILGAGKCGTSSLYYYLLQHPELFLPTVKEPDFFNSDDLHFEQKAHAYRLLFEGCESKKKNGEASAGYFKSYDRVIPRLVRLYTVTPPQFIILYRDPVERAISHFLHHECRKGKEMSLSEAKTVSKLMFKALSDTSSDHFQGSLYGKQLRRWLAYFPREQFCILSTQQFSEQPSTVLQTVFGFLGVSTEVQIDTSLRVNQASRMRYQSLLSFVARPPAILRPFGKALIPLNARRWFRQRLSQMLLTPLRHKPHLLPEQKASLYELFREDIQLFEKLAGVDCSAWYSHSLRNPKSIPHENHANTPY